MSTIQNIKEIIDYLNQPTEKKETIDNEYEPLTDDYDLSQIDKEETEELLHGFQDEEIDGNVSEDEEVEADILDFLEPEETAEFLVEGFDSVQAIFLKDRIIKRRFGSWEEFVDQKEKNERIERWEELLDESLGLNDKHKGALQKSLTKILERLSFKANPYTILIVTLILILIDRIILYKSFASVPVKEK